MEELDLTGQSFHQGGFTAKNLSSIHSIACISSLYTPTQSVGGWLLNREPTLVLDLEFCLTQSLSNTPLMVFRPIITFLLLWRFGLDPFVAILDPGKG